MFKQILTTVCVAAIMSAGSVAIADTVPVTGANITDTGAVDQDQGSLSNQANVTGGSNSNVSNSTILGGGTFTDTSTVNSTSNSNNSSTSTSIANQNGYVTSIPIIASAGTCLGSQGGTLSAAGIGIGTSSTIIDHACNDRQQQQLDANIQAQEAVTRANSVRLLSELGLQPAALSLLCQDPSIRVALKAGLEPAVYGKVCAIYEPNLDNISDLTAIKEY